MGVTTREIARSKDVETMTKLTVEMNDQMSTVLDQLAEKQGSTKAAVIRRSLTLMKLLEDEKNEGYKFGLSKNDRLDREIVIP
jgi:predicted transcriptional regulator